MAKSETSIWGPYFRETIKASGLLVPRLTDEQLRVFEEVAFEQLDEINLLDFRTKLVRATPEFAALALETFKVPFEELVTIDSVMPFDWDELCHGVSGTTIDDAMHRIVTQLPGWCDAGQLRWFGSDHNMPPYLHGSYEVVGLYVWGALRQDDWTAWKTSLAALTTGTIPHRTY